MSASVAALSKLPLVCASVAVLNLVVQPNWTMTASAASDAKERTRIVCNPCEGGRRKDTWFPTDPGAAGGPPAGAREC